MGTIREKEVVYGAESQPAEEGRKVSARLDAEAAQHLSTLTNIWGGTITEVLSRALAESAERASQRAANEPNAYEILLASGFIGSGTRDAPEDLSANYKHYVREAILEKHRSR